MPDHKYLRISQLGAGDYNMLVRHFLNGLTMMHSTNGSADVPSQWFDWAAPRLN